MPYPHFNPITEIQQCCGTLCNPKQVEEHILYLQRTVVELRAELLKVSDEKDRLLKDMYNDNCI